jgi:hypothetical protein
MTAGRSSPSGPPENSEPVKRAVSSIAVALATAICLFTQLHSPAASVAVLFLGIAALLIARQRVIQTAALFVIGVAAIDVVTFVAASSVNRSFNQRSLSHVDREMARVRGEIGEIESELQASADQVAAAVTAKPDMPRSRMFHLLAHQPHPPGRGMRIVGSNGDTLAWWGDELRVTGAVTYQFDVTNLYVTRTRPLSSAPLAVQAFQRIPNQPREHSCSIPATAPFLRRTAAQDPASRRYTIEKRPDSRFHRRRPHTR